jgi:hypothetical protein
MKTSTKIDASGVDTAAVTDLYFAKPRSSKAKTESEFFKDPSKKKEPVSEQKKEQQNAVDK